jgi:cell wall-associated protease
VSDEITSKDAMDERVELLYAEVTAKALKRHDKILRKEMGVEEYTIKNWNSLFPRQDRAAKPNSGISHFMKRS